MSISLAILSETVIKISYFFLELHNKTKVGVFFCTQCICLQLSAWRLLFEHLAKK